MHRDGAQRAEFPRPRRLGEPLADGHVADYLRLRKHDAMGTRERDGLRELVTDDAERCPAIANLIFIYLLLSMHVIARMELHVDFADLELSFDIRTIHLESVARAERAARAVLAPLRAPQRPPHNLLALLARRILDELALMLGE